MEAMGSVAPVDLADGELIRRQKNLVHYPDNLDELILDKKE